MNRDVRRPLASWRMPDRRALRPQWWCIALVAAGMLLVEVWQSSKTAELCLALGLDRTAVQRAEARVEYLRAQLDRRATRAELTPQALRLGLVPADAKQVVQLPPEYLAVEDRRTGPDSRSVLAWAERLSRAVVPEAWARGREPAN